MKKSGQSWESSKSSNADLTSYCFPVNLRKKLPHLITQISTDLRPSENSALKSYRTWTREKRNQNSHDCKPLVLINISLFWLQNIRFVSVEPGSFIQQTFPVCRLCATHTSWHQLSLLMLRDALNSTIWDMRHPREQSLRKWLGFSELPGVFGIHS